MRNFWKRANRGLILGGVLLLGTCVYVGIDYLRFSNGKADMEQVLRGYTADLAQAAITPDSQASYGYQKTDAQKEAAYQQLADVIRTYWTDTYDSSAGYYATKSNTLMDMYTLAYNTEYPGYVTDYTANAYQIKLTKNGPNAAKFSMNVDVVIDTYGVCYFPLLSDYDTSYYDDGATGDDEYTFVTEDGAVITVGTEKVVSSTDDSYYEGALRTSGTITYSGELLYEDGAWKISWFEWSWHSLQTKAQEGGN